MKTTRKIIGILWMVICGYFFARLVQGLYERHPDRLDTLFINLFFVLLFLAGAVASFFLIIRAGWARIVVSAVALLTMVASVIGLFAWFNSPPFSFVGIVFDIFALTSAGVLLLSRKYAVV
jgi:hypothetical protein